MRWSAASSCPAAPSASGATPKCSAASVAPRLARLRKEVEAADRTELARFLPSWQNVDAFRARRCRPRPPARGAGPAAGGGADPESVGARRAAAPARRLLPELARPALHQRRADLDRGREPGAQRRPRRPLLPRGRPPRRPAARQRQAGDPAGGGPRRDPRAARRRAFLLARPASPTSTARPRTSTTRSGTSPGRAR